MQRPLQLVARYKAKRWHMTQRAMARAGFDEAGAVDTLDHAASLRAAGPDCESGSCHETPKHREGSLLEHFVDKSLLCYSLKEISRELTNPLIPRRRFKRKLPDHRRR